MNNKKKLVLALIEQRQDKKKNQRRATTQNETTALHNLTTDLGLSRDSFWGPRAHWSGPETCGKMRGV